MHIEDEPCVCVYVYVCVRDITEDERLIICVILLYRKAVSDRE